MTYTNLASRYKAGPGAAFAFNLDSWNRFSAAHPNLSGQQFKVAAQQLQDRGLLSRPLANKKLRDAVFSGTPGMHSPLNPMGRYQGPWGNLGIKAYTAARDSGQFNLADIPTLAGKGSMFLPSGASAQWTKDMEAQMAQQYEEQETPYFTTGSSEVGTSAMGVKTAKDPNASKTGGTAELKRKNFLINKSLNV
jgi:hypothetical protein